MEEPALNGAEMDDPSGSKSLSSEAAAGALMAGTIVAAVKPTVSAHVATVLAVRGEDFTVKTFRVVSRLPPED